MFSNSYTPVKFERDCHAVMVPEGAEVELPSGTTGYITQSLGGQFHGLRGRAPVSPGR